MYEALRKDDKVKQCDIYKNRMLSDMPNEKTGAGNNVRIQLKKNNWNSDVLKKDVRIIQKQPALPAEQPDEDIIRLFVNGTNTPINAVIKDERRREDGAPQQLSMLTYMVEGQEVFIHIHILGAGRYYGHIIWGRSQGAPRLDLKQNDCDAILTQAELSEIAVQYREPPRDQRWEMGDYGHEIKGGGRDIAPV